MIDSVGKFINKAIKDLDKDGFALMKGYMSDSIELTNFKNKIYELVCIKANQYNVKRPNKSNNSISRAIIEIDSINNKIGGFLNDVFNASPELYQLLSSRKIVDLACNIIGSTNSSIMTNNYRSRIQIPGHDDIANLPWHQDSHYNNFYKYNNSIVIWISINDINKEMGPVMFKKGSQIVNKLPVKDYIKPGNQIVYTVDEKYITNNDYKECAVQTESGDVVLIDMNVIHRSGENKTNDQVKLSAQCRCHNASKTGFLSHYN